MPKTIEQAITFRVPPERLYRLYLNAREHAAACGTFLLLMPGRMIVQTWRGSNWKRSDLDSVLTFTFEGVPGGSRLTMVHANVPDANAKSIGSRTGGWHGHYWRPWKAYLKRKR